VKSWAVVGYGTVGLAHALALQGSEHANLCGIVDPTPQARRRAGDRVGVPTFPSLDDLRRRHQLDAITVAAPTGLHEEIVIQAVDAGVAVLCEKPLSDSRTACIRMLDHSSRSGVPFGAILNYRGYRQLRWIRDQLRSGQLQALGVAVEGTFVFPPPDRRAHNGGVLMAIGIHYIDLLRWWLGEPTSMVATTGGEPGSEDQANLLVHFDSCDAILTFAWTPNPGEPVRLRLETTSGRLMMVGQRVHAVGEALDTLLPAPDKPVADLPYGSGHLVVIEQAAAAFDAGRPFPISASEGARAVELCELAYRSAASASWIEVSP